MVANRIGLETIEPRPRRVVLSRCLALTMIAVMAMFLSASGALAADEDAPGESPRKPFFGRVTSEGVNGRPVVGAMVSVIREAAGHSMTVMTDDDGRFVSPPVLVEEEFRVRVRRIGWVDGVLQGGCFCS